MPSKRVRSWEKGVVKIHSPNSLQEPNNHRIIQNVMSLVSPKVTDKPMKKIIEIHASFQLKLWPHYSLLHLDWELRFLIDFYDLWIINDIHSSVIVNWFPIKNDGSFNPNMRKREHENDDKHCAFWWLSAHQKILCFLIVDRGAKRCKAPACWCRLGLLPTSSEKPLPCVCLHWPWHKNHHLELENTRKCRF